MANETKKATSFVKEVLARLVGDDNEALAQKIARKSMSALQGQIATLNARLVDNEADLEDAVELFNDAQYPTEYIRENSMYCSNIAVAQKRVWDAENVVQDTKDSIVTFKGILKDF